MKVSEKSLELNVGAELLQIMRTEWGMPKAYLRGLTQREERQEGVDFFAQLSPNARIFAFQFKAPRGRDDSTPYRYTLVFEQHDLLYDLAMNSPRSVYYVLPFYVTLAKLQEDVPTLMADTWLLSIADMPTPELFRGRRTTTVRCQPGIARANPGYRLQNMKNISTDEAVGIPVRKFAEWYHRASVVDRRAERQRNPWLRRGLRIVIADRKSASS